MCKKFLDRHGQGTVESGEVFEEVSFFAEPETINHRYTVRSVESSKSFGNLGVCVDWEVAANIREDESFIVNTRNFVGWELKHLMDYLSGLLGNILGGNDGIGARGGLALAVATSCGRIGRESGCERCCG